MNIRPIKTPLFSRGQDLASFILSVFRNQRPPEGSILAVTSKIVSLAENRLVPKDSISKADLVKRESDEYWGEGSFGCHLTVKHGLLIPSAGIDESNSESGDYILYPEDPFRSAQALCQTLRREWGLQRLGVLMTDSHTTPLRVGVLGVALSYTGFHGIRREIGKPDLFGRQLKMTQVDVADALAVAAVFLMGEAAESCPLALIEGAPIDFCEPDLDLRRELVMSPKDDLYAPLFPKQTP